LANEQITRKIDEFKLFVKTEKNYYFGAWNLIHFTFKFTYAEKWPSPIKHLNAILLD
jgi:hypothetical protein